MTFATHVLALLARCVLETPSDCLAYRRAAGGPWELRSRADTIFVEETWHRPWHVTDDRYAVVASERW